MSDESDFSDKPGLIEAINREILRTEVAELVESYSGTCRVCRHVNRIIQECRRKYAVIYGDDADLPAVPVSEYAHVLHLWDGGYNH